MSARGQILPLGFGSLIPGNFCILVSRRCLESESRVRRSPPVIWHACRCAEISKAKCARTNIEGLRSLARSCSHLSFLTLHLVQEPLLRVIFFGAGASIFNCVSRYCTCSEMQTQQFCVDGFIQGMWRLVVFFQRTRLVTSLYARCLLSIEDSILTQWLRWSQNHASHPATIGNTPPSNNERKKLIYLALLPGKVDQFK